jgi:hypothetical protein
MEQVLTGKGRGQDVGYTEQGKDRGAGLLPDRAAIVCVRIVEKKLFIGRGSCVKSVYVLGVGH